MGVVTKLTIAVFVPEWPAKSVPNGIVTYYSNLIPEYLSRGHDVIVLTPKLHPMSNLAPNLFAYEVDLESAPKRFRGLNFLMRFSPEYYRYLVGANRIAKALNEIQKFHTIDILEMEESFGWHARIAQLVKFPVVVRLHGPHFLNGSSEFLGKQSLWDRRRIIREGESLRTATAISSPSNSVWNETRKFYDIDSSSIRIIANPLNSIDIKQHWHFSECNPNEILFVGRFDLHKGGDLVLRAFSRLVRKYPNLKLTFAGPDIGVASKQGTVLPIHEFVASNLDNLSDKNFEFLGYVPTSEVVKLRQRAFLTIAASRYEVFGYTAFEALAFGCPLVASDIGGISEIIKNMEHAVLFKPGDSDELAASIEFMINNKDVAIQLAEAGQKLVYSVLNPGNCALVSLQFYEEIVRNIAEPKVVS